MNQTEPKLSKWPFFLGDVILVGLAYFIYAQSHRPMTAWEIGLFVLSAALGATSLVTPFILEYRSALKRSETNTLAATVVQVQNIEQVAQQIGLATSQWQAVQEQSAKTAATANQMVERISGEAKGFVEFLQKANDNEKTHLRLELEKCKRVEGEWLQVTVRMLDHIYALNQAATRSGQRNLIEQLGNFQNACRDVVRRVGLGVVLPNIGDAFDPQLHQLQEGQEQPQPNSQVGEVLATGFTYQGQLIRPALVAIQTEIFIHHAPEPEPAEAAAPETPVTEAAPEVSVSDILQRKEPVAEVERSNDGVVEAEPTNDGNSAERRLEEQNLL